MKKKPSKAEVRRVAIAEIQAVVEESCSGATFRAEGTWPFVYKHEAGIIGLIEAEMRRIARGLK